MPRRLQSILALAAGFVLIVILAFGADAMFSKSDNGHNPHDPARFALALCSALLFSASGSYVTARLAPRRPLRHALELGLLVTLLMAAIDWYDPSPADQVETQIAILITILPAAWLGGALRERQLSPA